MNVDILIVSHGKDVDWLRYCLLSLHKFASGFRNVVVVWPRLEQEIIAKAKLQGPIVVRLFDQKPYPLGQLHHQVQKCFSDLHCPGADYIFHIDSDAILREPTKPEDFFVDGKPILLIDTWNNAGNGRQWKPMVDSALKIDSQYETMRWMTIVHHRDTYPGLRDFISTHHGIAFEDYVLSQKPEYPQGFAEFNTIGNFALLYRSEWYHIWNIPRVGRWPSIKYIQFWSHGGLERVIPEPNNEFCGKTPRQVMALFL
jgi:hypothetical protein